MEVSDEKPVSVRFCAGVSRSATVNANGPALESSAIVWVPTDEIVGGSLTEFTVNTKEFVVLVPSGSSTTNVIRAVPNWFVAGKSVTKRLLPVPLKEMFSFGSRLVLDEEAVRDRSAIELSTSPTRTATARA